MSKQDLEILRMLCDLLGYAKLTSKEHNKIFARVLKLLGD